MRNGDLFCITALDQNSKSFSATEHKHTHSNENATHLPTRYHISSFLYNKMRLEYAHTATAYSSQHPQQQHTSDLMVSLY